MHHEELHDLYSWTNIIQAIKSRRIKLSGHVAVWSIKQIHTVFQWENLQ